MRQTYCIGICFLLMFVISACAPKDVPFRGIFKPDRPAQALFEKAEQKYGQSDYTQARDLYGQYLEQYPDADRAADARFKLAMIEMHGGDHDAARQLFRDLVRDLPQSAAAGRARVGVVESFVQQGQFQNALDYRRQLAEDLLEPQQLIRAELLAGDAQMALGRFGRAYETFLRAFDRAEKQQQPHVGRRLMAAAFTMTPQRLQKEIDRLDGQPPSGYLMYQQALVLAAEASIGDALSVLQKFTDRFPDHRLASEARQEMDRLTEQALFKDNRVGCVLPLSGRYEKFGRRALRGIELAVYQAGDSMDFSPPVQLMVRDSGSDPETARKAVEDLAGQGVAAIIGPMTGGTEPLAEAQKRGVPIIALTQKAGVTDSGAYVFRNFLTPEMQVAAVVKHAVEQRGCRRFAVLYPDEPYGETFFHLFWDQLIARGGRVVGAESYDPDQTDFAGPIKKLVGLYHKLPEDLKPEQPDKEEYDGLIEAVMPPNDRLLEKQQTRKHDSGLIRPEQDDKSEPEPIVDFDALFIPDSPEKAGLIIPQLRYHDINEIELLGTNLWHSPRIIEIAGRHLGRTVIPEGFFEQSRNRQVRDFVSAFSEIYGQSPGFIEAAGYDSAMLICRQLAGKQVESRPALRKALVEMPPFEGVTGRTRFDPSGEAEKELYLLDVINGRFVQIAP